MANALDEKSETEEELAQLRARYDVPEGSLSIKQAALALDPTRLLFGEKRLTWWLIKKKRITREGRIVPQGYRSLQLVKRVCYKVGLHGETIEGFEVLITPFGLEVIRRDLIEDGRLPKDWEHQTRER